MASGSRTRVHMGMGGAPMRQQAFEAGAMGAGDLMSALADAERSSDFSAIVGGNRPTPK